MSSLPLGGSYLFSETKPEDVFTPEDFTDEHKMIGETTTRFVNNNILPVMEEIEEQKEGMLTKLLMDCAELGLLGIDVQEKYDGMDLGKVTSGIVAERMGRAGTFGMMAHGGTTGIGSMPIVYFGNEDQKSRYLPGIVSADIVGAYALTEPEAGSDAMSIKTRAVLSPDGKYYLLNGTKQFISNAIIAGIFIVFAKIDGDKFTTFIVDKDAEGLTLGPEEKKMGIKGSSTRTVIMENCKVPVENLLFEIGKGHVVAFNTLNLGRYKMAASSVGQAKFALELSATYGNERTQFRTPIGEFGLIKEKLAEMATKIYAAESSLYRLSGLLEDALSGMHGVEDGQAAARLIEEYALECAANKIFATEILAYCVDEGVQIFGGYGFSSEYTIERLYRDARVTRIFEGTNEINRSIIPANILRKKGLPLQEAFEKVGQMAKGGAVTRKNEVDLVQAAKDVFVYTLAEGMKKQDKALMKSQEFVGRFADMAILTLAMESALLRSQKTAKNQGADKAKTQENMARLFVYTTFDKVAGIAKDTLAAIFDGADLETRLEQLQSLAKYTPCNTVAVRREIAAVISAAGKYVV